MRRVTIVGGSLAGLRAGEALRREGFDGDIRIVSGEEHLPFDRPPLSKQVLAGTWDPERARLRGADELEADWILGRRAVGLDVGRRSVTLDTGEVIDGDGVIVATGSSPRRLPPAIAPPELAGVHVLRTIGDCLALASELRPGARLVVIGAGFIGLEVAATAKAMGVDVTVIEALAAPLERALGTRMGTVCARLHSEHGVDIRLGVGVAGLKGNGDGRVARVQLADGTSVDAEVVVVGIGVAPETAWLDGSGLAIDNGIVCDARCQAAPGIVAAGDVARWAHPRLGRHVRVEHWTNAAEQGSAAATTLVRGDAAPAYNPVPYFWSDQHGTKIQFLGHADPLDEVEIVEGSIDEGRFVATYRHDGRITGALLWNRASRVPAWIDRLSGGDPDSPPGGDPTPGPDSGADSTPGRDSGADSTPGRDLTAGAGPG